MGWGGEGGIQGPDVQIITVLAFSKVLPVKLPDSTNLVGKALSWLSNFSQNTGKIINCAVTDNIQ